MLLSPLQSPACTHCSAGIIYGCHSLQSRIFPVKLDNSLSLSTVLTVCALLLTPPKQTHATEKIINSTEGEEEACPVYGGDSF